MRSINIRILLATVLISGLSIGATAIATNAQGFTNTTSGNSLKGSLTSIQTDDSNTSWIVSGAFRMDNINIGLPYQPLLLQHLMQHFT